MVLRRWDVAVLVGLLLPTTPVYARSGLEQFSDAGAVGLPVAALALTLAEGDTSGLGAFIVSTGVSVGTVYGLKEIVPSTRPNGSPGSFPSGHTAWAFSAAAYLERRYGWEVGLPAHALAIGVAVARVESRNHRWGDVIASAVISELAAWAFVGKEDDSVQYFPWSKNSDVGVTMAINF